MIVCIAIEILMKQPPEGGCLVLDICDEPSVRS